MVFTNEEKTDAPGPGVANAMFKLKDANHVTQ